MSTRPYPPQPASASNVVERFLEIADPGGSWAEDMRAFAPRLGRRLGAMEDERSAIVAALTEIPAGERVPVATILARIRTLVKAETQAVFECYWHDLGGEA